MNISKPEILSMINHGKIIKAHAEKLEYKISFMSMTEFYQGFPYLDIERILEDDYSVFYIPDIVIHEAFIEEVKYENDEVINEIKEVLELDKDTPISKLIEKMESSSSETIEDLMRETVLDRGYVEEKVIERLLYWNLYGRPQIADENVALRCGLIPFYYDNEMFLAIGGAGMDMSSKYEAYFAYLIGSLPRDTQFFEQSEYTKSIVGEEVFNEVERIVKYDPPITRLEVELENNN